MTLPVIASRKDAIAPGLRVRVVVGEITLMGFTSSCSCASYATHTSARCRAHIVRPRRALVLSRTYSEIYSVPVLAAGSVLTSPEQAAMCAASRRFAAPSFERILATWLLAVG